MYGFELLSQFFGITDDLSNLDSMSKDEAFKYFSKLTPNVFDETKFTGDLEDFYVNYRIDLDEYREGKCPYFVKNMYIDGDKIMYIQVRDTERYKLDKDNKVWKMTHISGKTWFDTCPLMPHELVHTWLLRDNYHIDCLGMTEDLDEFLLDFKFFGNMEIKSFDNLEDFLSFLKNEVHYIL